MRIESGPQSQQGFSSDKNEDIYINNVHNPSSAVGVAPTVQLLQRCGSVSQ